MAKHKKKKMGGTGGGNFATSPSGAVMPTAFPITTPKTAPVSEPKTTPKVKAATANQTLATLYGPDGKKVPVEIGSQEASSLQSQGYGLTPGSYKAPDVFGQVGDQPKFGSQDPDVIAFMNKNPGVSLEAAIGSVATNKRRKAAIVTSQLARTDAKANVDAVSQIAEPGTTPPAPIRPVLSPTELNSMRADLGLGPIPEGAISGSSTTITSEILANGDKIPLSAYGQEVFQLDAVRQAMYDDLQGMRDRIPQRNQAQLDEIARQFDKARQAERTRNANRQKSLEIIGIQSGRQRYAPTIQGGIIDKEVKEGLDRLTELDFKEQSLIQSAKTASEDQDFQLLAQQRGLILEAQKAKGEELDRMQKNIMNQQTMAIRQSQEDRAEKKSILEQLDLYTKVEGELSQEAYSQLDRALDMGDGVSEAYINYSKNKALAESAASTQKNLFDTAKNITDIASKIKEGGWIDVGNTRIFGTKEIDAKKNLFEDTIIEDGVKYKIRKRLIPGTNDFEIIDTVRLGEEGLLGGNTPNSYKEWQLSGSPGTYKNWIKKTNLRPLPAASAKLLSEGKQLPFTLNSLDKVLKENRSLFGPIKGQIAKFPYASEQKKIDADLRLASQTIGRYLEGGVLRKEDEEKYRKMLPQITDLPSVAEHKLKLVKDLIEDKSLQFISDFDAAGFDVSNFMGDLPGTEVLINEGKIESFKTEDDFIRAYPAKIDMYFDLMNDFPGEPWEVIRERIKIIDPSFKNDLSMSTNFSEENLSKLSNGRTELSIGEGTVTSIDGSSAWKWGLDFVLGGGRGANVALPFNVRVIDIARGFINNKNKPLSKSEAKKQNGGFGNQVKVELQDGSQMWLSHLEDVANLAVGQELNIGESLGKQGNTGNTAGKTGVHVDITMVKPDGSKYTPREVAAILKDKRLG